MLNYNDELEEMIATKNLMNSYKLYFLKALIVNVSKEKRKFSFYEMASWMCAYSFRDVCSLGQRIRPLDKLYDVAVMTVEKEGIMESSSISEVYNAVYSTKDKELHRSVISLCNYVPYRLLAYIWPLELRGKTDRQKNRLIEEMSQVEERSIYCIFTICSDNKSIEVYQEWVSFIVRNRKTLIPWIEGKISGFVGKDGVV